MSTDERIDNLHDQLQVLRGMQADLTKELAQARVDRWQERIDDLELSVHLGAMDGSERITALSEKLRNQWARTQAQMEDASTTASTATETMRSGLEDAYRDVRDALLETRSKVTHR